jgi:hypothetical protein
MNQEQKKNTKIVKKEISSKPDCVKNKIKNKKNKFVVYAFFISSEIENESFKENCDMVIFLEQILLEG